MKTSDISDLVFASMADGILFVDRDNVVRICNERAAELRASRPEDIIGRPVLECHDPSSRAKVMRVIESLKKHPGRVHRRSVHRSDRTFEIVYSGVFDEKAEMLGVLAVSREITDKLKLARKLARMSITDALTGLYNHRHFYNILKQEMARARRHDRPLSLLLFDLDKFKEINDTLGHDEGDATLKTIGKLVKKNIRAIDFAFRYGGDEFTVILPEATRVEAFNAAERLRAAIEKAHLGHITLSIGLAELKEVNDAIEFVRLTDNAMYSAKKQGGNRICLFGGACRM